MSDIRSISQISPGRGLGWITIGASLHGIVSRLKAQPHLYSQLDLSYSSAEPILDPIILTLPANGIRLRFDGPDQRLRLIEIIDFSCMTFYYKNIELVRRTNTSTEEPQPAAISGPSFRHIYNRLFGPAYAGEYNPPPSGQPTGTYILSYPGLAVRFSLKHKSWSDKADFVSLLTAAASPASSIAIFSGSSWPEVRDDLYTTSLSLPRSLPTGNKSVEGQVEIDRVIIHGGGKVELLRLGSPFVLLLGDTTPQDLIAELGPPDAIFRKNLSRLSIHAASQPRNASSPLLHPLNSEQSSSASITGPEDESESETVEENEDGTTETFYNYFHHGFDVLISSPTGRSPALPHESRSQDNITDYKLVATKVFFHANIPGSYSFNRHRRSRWVIPLEGSQLTSEMRFSDISSALKSIWKDHYSSTTEQESFERGMVLNRGWGESPESSIELLGEMEESTIASTIKDGSHNTVSSNTQLFGFPGMLFEVVKGDLVSCVTVY